MIEKITVIHFEQAETCHLNIYNTCTLTHLYMKKSKQMKQIKNLKLP